MRKGEDLVIVLKRDQAGRYHATLWLGDRYWQSKLGHTTRAGAIETAFQAYDAWVLRTEETQPLTPH